MFYELGQIIGYSMVISMLYNIVGLITCVVALTYFGIKLWDYAKNGKNL